jgi:mono/diheme cytochrome c family protein
MAVAVRVWSGCVLGLALLAGGAAGAAAPDGAAVFAAHCAVCHGATAAGVPGSFPPLGAQVIAFAKLPAGRDYLVTAVSGGLIGSVQVAGETYSGAMPPQNMLSEAEVAAVLSFLASDQGKAKSGVQAFGAQEVVAIRARHPGVAGVAALALRPTLPGT